MAHSGARARIELHVWERMHDRYLIANLMGISVPYGFDTDPAGATWICWSRLARQDSDEVLREFELRPASLRIRPIPLPPFLCPVAGGKGMEAKQSSRGTLGSWGPKPWRSDEGRFPVLAA